MLVNNKYSTEERFLLGIEWKLQRNCCCLHWWLQSNLVCRCQLHNPHHVSRPVPVSSKRWQVRRRSRTNSLRSRKVKRDWLVYPKHEDSVGTVDHKCLQAEPRSDSKEVVEELATAMGQLEVRQIGFYISSALNTSFHMLWDIPFESVHVCGGVCNSSVYGISEINLQGICCCWYPLLRQMFERLFLR